MPAAEAPVDKSESRVREMFRQVAPRYDAMNHLLSLNIDRYWRWRTVKLVPPTGQTPILDVCTGTGDLALAYYKAGQGKIPIVATDFCPEMLAVGESKKQRIGLNGQVQFLEADTQQLPFEDDHFQIVSVAFGLRNVSDTRAGLREMIRVCRPGGRVAVLEFSSPTMPGLAGAYRWYFRNVLPRVGQLFASNREDAYHYLPATVAEFPSGEALAEIMRGCGLEKVAFTPLTFGIATLYVGRKPEEEAFDAPALAHA
jgi:demethylmenaquinone methyltransferase / 2-methoxy-6-polyprenyl-1,4-benzoquinol methylase